MLVPIASADSVPLSTRGSEGAVDRDRTWRMAGTRMEEASDRWD
jgi:hypothetical protein